MIINTIPEFCIQYDEELHVVRAAWTGGRNMSRFRTAMVRLGQLLDQLRVERAVLEFSNLPDVPVYDQLWLSTDYIPTLFLLHLRQLVVVLANSPIYNQQVLEDLVTAVHPLMECDVQFFAQPDAAMHWLTNDSARVPDLLQEWDQHCKEAGRCADEVAEPQARY